MRKWLKKHGKTAAILFVGVHVVIAVVIFAGLV